LNKSITKTFHLLARLHAIVIPPPRQLNTYTTTPYLVFAPEVDTTEQTPLILPPGQSVRALSKTAILGTNSEFELSEIMIDNHKPGGFADRKERIHDLLCM
jgi:hypothetical protein